MGLVSIAAPIFIASVRLQCLLIKQGIPYDIASRGAIGKPSEKEGKINEALDNYNLNGFLVRSSDKEHGTKKSIEGVSIKGKSVILVEDVVSTGGSLIKAIEKLRSQDSKVNSILSIVDREMGADSKFLDMGIDYLPLFHISELV